MGRDQRKPKILQTSHMGWLLLRQGRKSNDDDAKIFAHFFPQKNFTVCSEHRLCCRWTHFLSHACMQRELRSHYLSPKPKFFTPDLTPTFYPHFHEEKESSLTAPPLSRPQSALHARSCCGRRPLSRRRRVCCCRWAGGQTLLVCKTDASPNIE